MFECTCLPLNRRLMAHMLKVEEGSVHEQDCVERAEQEAADAARKAAIAAVEAVRDSDWRDCPGSCHDFTVDAVIEAIQQSGADR